MPRAFSGPETTSDIMTDTPHSADSTIVFAKFTTKIRAAQGDDATAAVAMLGVGKALNSQYDATVVV